jgi:IclR family KDG regulon transcriptional repressor
MTQFLGSAEKALNLISLFDLTHQDFYAQEFSHLLSIPLSTTYKYLDLLTRKGFLVKNPDTKKFSLGYNVFRLGNVMLEGLKLVDLALPIMKSLSMESGETVLLTVLNGWEATCLERIETQKLIKLSIERGSTFPLHASAPAKVLLAFQDDPFLQQMVKEVGLPRLTQNTIQDPAKLKKELTKIRKRGIAFSDSEVDYGAGSLAAPVFDYKGRVMAGLAIAGPRDRMNIRKNPRLIDMVKKHALQLSQKLGYRIASIRSSL